MKKFSIFLLGALAMAASSCEDAPEPAPMQSNPQEPVLAAGDIKGVVAGALASTSVVALEDAKGKDIEVFKFTEIKDVPAGGEVFVKFQLSASSDFSGKVETIPVTMLNGVASVSSDLWNTAHINLFGKSPKEKTAYYRLPVYIAVNGSDYRYDSETYYAATGVVKETCMDAGFVIYDKYYFLSDATSWDLADADISTFAFSHSDADVYDDPVFTFKFELTQELLDAKDGGCYWKIASQKAVETGEWNYVYGPEINGDEEFSGFLVGDGAAQAGKLTLPGKYRVTINMEAMTYEIQAITRPDWVAVPSNANGWNDSGSRLYWSNKDDKPYFCGAARVNNTDGGFKFIWDGSWFGGADGKIDAAGGNILAPVDGDELYWFTVSTDDMTYTMTPVTSIGVIGDMNGWGGQEPLTPDASLLIWSGDVNLTGNWKIRINDDWAMNYGGPDMANPTFDGDNFSGYEGLHTVAIDFTGNRPVITVTAK